jgi:hypothetical protein
MKDERRARPTLEPLEDRLCPSLTVHSAHGELDVKGDPSSGTLDIVQTAAGPFQVFDGPSLLGTFSAVKDINVRTGNSPASVSLTLAAGGKLTGSVLIQTGKGSDLVSINGTGTGRIGGDVVVTGRDLDQAFLGNTSAVSVGGSVLFLGTGDDTFGVGGGSTIGGGVTALSRAGSFELGFQGGARVNGAITVGYTGPGGNAATLDPGTVVGGSFSYFAAGESNQVTLGGSVKGSAFVGTSGGFTGFFLGPDASVGGNLFYLGLGGNNLSVAGSIGGNASLLLGNGDSLYFFDTTSSVGGNLTVNAGNGTDQGFLLGTVHGSLRIVTGNGDNSLLLNGNINGPVTFQSGTGNDAVTVGGTNHYALAVHLGKGANTFTYLPGASLGQATLDFGAGSSGDSYMTNGVVVTWPQTILNLA